MSAILMQRYILGKPADASPIMPQHVALTDEEGNAVLGKLDKLPDGATVKATAAAYNALVDALVAAGLASE
ncbi:hypothetical protein [Adlercreutzia sp. ZJ141]|uniref:hypothetical protein n=1 Tax=Adlercreutzia sp. ZJ141 TaxID=2709406 RepID=UPI0013EC0215|nr:hypothetical protein [Adlercreutzia sp. ZJ141]